MNRCRYDLDLDAAVRSIELMNSSPTMLASDRIVAQLFGPVTDLNRPAVIAERVAVLDGLWGTRLFMEAGAADRIVDNILRHAQALVDLLGGLQDNDLENKPDRVIVVARDVMPVILTHSDASERFRQNYSFAAKFFHWCTGVHFPIVDRRARERINAMQTKLGVQPRIRKTTDAMGDLTYLEEYERWITFYSDLIAGLAASDRERLCRADYDSQPHACRIKNSLLRILDKVLYVQGGGSGLGRVSNVVDRSRSRSRERRTTKRDGPQEPQAKRRTRSENAEYVIRTIRSLGIEPHPQSRLMKMHRVLTEAGGVIRAGDPGFETALEAERDLQLLAFVMDQIKTRDDAFVRLVRIALKDSVVPQHDLNQSRGRDAQFELYVAAVCSSAGLLPVDFAEPDVICYLGGTRYGIAAKRVKSAANLENTVRKAANQIEKSGQRGIIALDICLALNPDNRKTATAIPDDKFGCDYRQEIRDRLDAEPNLQSWIEKPGVLGIVLHDHRIRWIGGNEWELASFTMRIARTDEQDRFASFAKRYIQNLPDLTRMS